MLAAGWDLSWGCQLEHPIHVAWACLWHGSLRWEDFLAGCAGLQKRPQNQREGNLILPPDGGTTMFYKSSGGGGIVTAKLGKYNLLQGSHFKHVFGNHPCKK